MKMWTAIAVACAAFVLTEGLSYHHPKLEAITSVCDPVYNNTNIVQCYCINDNMKPEIVRNAECYAINEDIKPDDSVWEAFNTLNAATRITFSNTRGITLKFVPTNALKHTNAVVKLDIKYANIDKIGAYAFSNLSHVQVITLSDDQITTLGVNAFAHHNALTTINLDTNTIIEINRDVFVDLPSLEKLFLTNNKITTIHDRAFIHLSNLKELEMDRNGLFSLNSESFSGLRNLQKLDLSSNALEVIGDNTFLPLVQLKILNLEDNKIQMLDEKAFHGLSKLQSLSLARNKLIDIDNVKVFEGLKSLTHLSLRGNKMNELKAEVLAPILSNFHQKISNLDVEDNEFPCSCGLDWFMSLMNKTENSNLKLALENLKCTPDETLRESWTKLREAEKNKPANDAEEGKEIDYEYYDESELNGKLFFIDVRDLICSKNNQVNDPAIKPNSIIETTTKILTTKATSSPVVTTVKVTTEYVPTKVTNHGLLDLSTVDANTERDVKEAKEDKSITTTRLATVSAKPIENEKNEDKMAADEAKPDKIKAHRSIQDRAEEAAEFNSNSANINFGSVITLAIVCFSLCLH